MVQRLYSSGGQTRVGVKKEKEVTLCYCRARIHLPGAIGCSQANNGGAERCGDGCRAIRAAAVDNDDFARFVMQACQTITQ